MYLRITVCVCVRVCGKVEIGNRIKWYHVHLCAFPFPASLQFVSSTGLLRLVAALRRTACVFLCRLFPRGPGPGAVRPCRAVPCCAVLSSERGWWHFAILFSARVGERSLSYLVQCGAVPR